MRSLTLEEIQKEIGELRRDFAQAVSSLTLATERADRVTQIALARFGGHFSIDETAEAWGVSAKTVKRKIGKGELTLEQIPGTKVYGIPADEVFAWAPTKVLRKSQERERR